jgi:MFS transporter, MHS family, proline/betaine transporter
MVWSGVLGFLIGSVTVTLLQALLPAEAMESYGWRIPFLLAGPLGVVGLYIRLRLDDTPQFAELSKTQQVAQSPLREAVTTAWRQILQVIGLMVIFNVGYNVCVAGFGGTTPYVVTWLIAETGNSVVPAYYVVAAALISLLTILTMRETAGRPLPKFDLDETFQLQ